MAPLMRPLLVAALGLLMACDQDPLLPGQRFDVVAAPSLASLDAEAMPNVSLPTVSNSAQSVSPSGVAGPTVNAALANTPSLVFTTSIGSGNSKRGRISAAPIVVRDTVFTIDSRSQVSAVNSATGTILWQRSIAPSNDKGTELIGGGLSYGGGTLFAASAFGEVYALDPQTGREIWVQKLGAAANGTPSFDNGHVFVVSATGAAWKLSAETGRIAWRLAGDAQSAGTFGGAAPATHGNFVIFANSAGEVVNSYQNGGTLAWINKLAGADKGAAISAIEDIAGSPVISGSDVIVSNFGGRTARYDLNTGDTKWLAPIGTYNTPLAVGNAIFLISNDNELVRLSQSDGSVIWSQPLPKYTARRTKKRSEIFVHFGPLLGNGALIVPSSDGELRFFDPRSGELQQTLDIPHGAATMGIIANSTLYLINQRGELLAFK